MSANTPMPSRPTAPWWSFPHVWLVIAGPAVVVVASFITLYLALHSPNTVLEVEPTPQAASSQANMAPAMLARNHAATGVVPIKPAAPVGAATRP